MAETMIERVARRLCERDGGDPDEIRQGEGKAAGQSWTGWQAYASDAEDIIAVIGEPTEDMLVAGHRAARKAGSYVRLIDLHAAFTAMIEAARAGADSVN